MEAEAEITDNQLSAQINTRRRSASVSDDYSVQKTNEDATDSKYSAIKVCNRKLSLNSFVFRSLLDRLLGGSFFTTFYKPSVQRS